MIKIVVMILLMSVISFGAGRADTFIISILDRKVHVISPDKVKGTFTVLVENKSLSKLIGKISTPEGALKYVSVESGATETVEITHKSGSKVFFVPLSPAFQEIELIVGKKEYEIPSEK